VSAQRIHFMRYENLIQNTKNEILNLYINLGIELDEKVLSDTIDKSNLKFMSDSEAHYKAYNPNYKMDFVGKKAKIKKSEILTEDIKDYVLEICREEIEQFYPELLK